MKQGAYCVFERALGWCGIAWRERGDSSAPPAVTYLARGCNSDPPTHG